MKYRIKITTFKNGRKEYVSQFRTLMGWKSIHYNGELNDMFLGFEHKFETRESALRSIDLHFAGNTEKQTIEFEYITP